MRAVTVVGRAQQGVEGAARKQVVAYYKGEIMTANRIRINWIYKIYKKKEFIRKEQMERSPSARMSTLTGTTTFHVSLFFLSLSGNSESISWTCLFLFPPFIPPQSFFWSLAISFRCLLLFILALLFSLICALLPSPTCYSPHTVGYTADGNVSWNRTGLAAV